MQYKAQVPLETLRSVLSGRTNEIRAQKLDGGLVFDGHRYDTDPISLQNITATVAAISAGIPLPANFYWRTADNELVAHNAESITLLAAAALQFVNAAYGRSWVLKDSINASSEPETININEGWPVSS